MALLLLLPSSGGWEKCAYASEGAKTPSDASTIKPIPRSKMFKQNVGLRYGASLAKSSNLLSRSKYISAYYEAASSYLAGFRLYWDEVPKTNSEAFGERLEFGWRRWMVGFGFALPLPTSYSKLHLVPKIGQYSFASALVMQRGTRKYSQHINLDDAVGLGYELYLPIPTKSFVMKPWFGQDLAGAMLEENLHSSVDSKKIGLDIWVPLMFPTILQKQSSLVLVLFGMNETLTLKGKEELGGTKKDIKATINVPYAGLGLNWVW